MPSARSGTAATGAKTRRWHRATRARLNFAGPMTSFRLLFPLFPPNSIDPPPIAPRGSRSRARSRRWPRHPCFPASSSVAFQTTAPPCTRTRWPNSAALVPIERPATLRREKPRGGDMSSGHVLRSLACGVVLTIAAASSAGAEGTFDIPPGAHFNPQKLERVGDYLRDQVAQGKIPGAILLIQQHGKPVYHELMGLRDVVAKAPMSDDTIFR